MKVRREKYSNTFCGPAALSLLTGEHVDACIKELHAHRSRWKYANRPVRSVSKNEITTVLGNMGYRIDTRFHWEMPHIRRNHKPTLVALVRWLKRQEHWSPEKRYLLLVTGHWMVMKGIKLFDNSNPEGVFFGRYDQRRRRVFQVWEVTRRDRRPTSCPTLFGPHRQLAASS